MTPRRKKGRDKRKSDKKRNRKQDLPALNVIPFQKIGEPKPSASERDRIEPPITVHWGQGIPPYGNRTLEDAVVVSHLFKPRRIRLEDVDLKRLDKQTRKIRRRRARQILQLDAYNLSLSGLRLRKYQQYKGAKDYVERDGFWYIQLVGINIEIALFETESKARDWAWEYLGRA